MMKLKQRIIGAVVGLGTAFFGWNVIASVQQNANVPI